MSEGDKSPPACRSHVYGELSPFLGLQLSKPPQSSASLGLVVLRTWETLSERKREEEEDLTLRSSRNAHHRRSGRGDEHQRQQESSDAPRPRARPLSKPHPFPRRHLLLPSRSVSRGSGWFCADAVFCVCVVGGSRWGFPAPKGATDSCPWSRIFFWGVCLSWVQLNFPPQERLRTFRRFRRGN